MDELKFKIMDNTIDVVAAVIVFIIGMWMVDRFYHKRFRK